MKTVLTKCLVIASIGLLTLESCKKAGTEVKANSGQAGTLSVNSTTVALDKSKQGDTSTIVKFTFTKASYGFNAAIGNTLQIDVQGDNWQNPASYVLANGVYSQGFSTAVFNSLLLKLNLPTGVASTVNARIVNSLSANVTPIYSNVLTLSVTPYNLVSFVYVPGNYEGWSFPGKNADSLQSATSNGIYTGVIAFKLPSDPFLIVPIQSWANKWATPDPAGAAGGPITYNVQYVASGDNNFSSASLNTVDPNVKITIDLVVLNTNANTLTLTPTLWSVVGDASPGGWPAGSGFQSDTDMSFDNGTQTWSVVVNLTGGGNIKFRLNHDWGTNLGGSNGTLSAGGANIPIAASGKYLVTLDPVGLTYTVKPD